MKLKPIFDRVLVKELTTPKQTKSGISLEFIENPTQIKKGVVLKTGNGVYENGNFIKMQVCENDIIYFEEHCSVKINIENEEYFLLKQTDILAVENN